MSNTTITSPRHFLTQLLSSLPTAPSYDAQNRLQGLQPQHHSTFITLHVLFPNDFLPALDLLDRRLVTRFTVTVPGHTHTQQDAQTGQAETSASPAPEPHAGTKIYYVQSAQQQQQQRRSRYMSSYDTTHSYEVRLGAWNCSCPAFAFAAFPAASTSAGDEGAEEDARAEEVSDEGWMFGGLRKGQGMVPVCKHLLACLLVDKCELFADCVEEKLVSVEEAAGWAAGWAG